MVVSSLLLFMLIASFRVNASDWGGIDPCLDPINCIQNFLNINVSNPENCSQYFLCVGKALYPRQCPSLFQFDQNLGTCLDIRIAPLIHCAYPCYSDAYKQFIVYPSSSQPTPSSTRKDTTAPSTSSTSIDNEHASTRLTTSTIAPTSAVVSSQKPTSTSVIVSTVAQNATFASRSNSRMASPSTSGPTVTSTVSKKQTMTESTVDVTSSSDSTTSPLTSSTASLSTVKDKTTSLSNYSNTNPFKPGPSSYSASQLQLETTTSLSTRKLKDISSTLSRSSSTGTTASNEKTTTASLSVTDETTASISLLINRETTNPSKEFVPSKSTKNSETSTMGLSTKHQKTSLSSFNINGSTSSSVYERRRTTKMKSTVTLLTQTTLSATTTREIENNSPTAIFDTSTEFFSMSTENASESSTTTVSSTVSAKISTTISSADLWKLCNRENPCRSGDRFGDVVDCTKYFECVTFVDGGNYLMPASCPEEQVFDPFQKQCTNRSADNGNGGGICLGNICEMRASHTISIDPLPVLAGHSMSVLCSFRVLFVVQPIQVSGFRWQLNGYPLSSTGSDQRIRIGQVAWDDRGFWSSTLTFHPVTTRDSGSIDCIVQYGNQLTSTNSTGYFEVLPTPTVEINPLNGVVVRNENVTLVCGAAFEESRGLFHQNQTKRTASDFIFSWFRSSRLIDFSNDSDCIVSVKSANASVISCKQTSDSDYYCRVNYTFGYSDSVHSTIKIVEEHSLLCPSDNEDGTVWSPVAVNTNSVVSCGPNSIGYMTRKCVFDGNSAVWGAQNNSECVDKELAELLSMVHDVRQGISINSSNTTEEISSALRNYLSSHGSELNFGNFNTSLTILSGLSSIQSNAWNITKPGIVEIKSVLWSANSLLNSSNEFLWKDLIAQNAFGALPIMDVVNVYGKKWAKSLHPGSAESIRYENLAVTTVCNHASKVRNVTFPALSASDEQDWTSAVNDRIYFQNPLESQDDNNEKLYYISCSFFRNLNEYFPTTTDVRSSSHATLGSRIVSLTIDGLSNSKNLSIPVQIVLENIVTPTDNTLRKCVFWNTAIKPSGSWSDYGCFRSMSISNPKMTVCECNHLTNFAILFSPSPAKELNEIALNIISIIGCIVSIASLGLLLILFAVRWKRMRSHHAVVIINLCVALMAANVVFLAGVNKTEEKVACTIVAVLLHYLFLAAFCVMLIEGIQLLLYIARPFYVHRKRDTAILLITAWVIPLTVVGISLAVTRTEGYGGKESCWLSTTNGLLWAFVGPALAIITANFVILVIVLVNVARTKKASEQTTKYRVWATVWNVFIIVPVLGVTWVFGVFSVNEDLVAFQYIFAIANSFQGFFIFLFHGLCHKKRSTSQKLARTSFRQMWDSPSRTSSPSPLPPPPPPPPPTPPPLSDTRKHAKTASRSMKSRLENHWQRLSRRHAVNWAAVAAAAVASSTDDLELRNCDGDGDDRERDGTDRGTLTEETFSRSLRPTSSQSASAVTRSRTSTDRTDILF